MLTGQITSNIYTTPQDAATGNPMWRYFQPRAIVPNSVFVIMSFQGEGTAEVLDLIRDECCKLGLNAGRADDAVGSDLVILKIAQFIEEAELIICDLTYERPNVYYELGYAHGVGNRGDRILLISREDAPRHFDINGLHTRLYSSLDNLRMILQKTLPPMISGLRQSRIETITPAGPTAPASSTLDRVR